MAQLAVFKIARAKCGRQSGAVLAGKRVLAAARRCCDGRHWTILKVDVRSCREVSVNSGGEPERDDTGLPPVDIEIPDDARELDRDVQAYFREQRAERRRLRHHRLHRRLTRDGILLPLLACCLILALIAGTLLTVFTATSENLTQKPGYGTGTSGPPAGSPRVMNTGLPLPPGTLRLAGSDQAISLQSLGQSPSMLVLVPLACRCGPAVNSLARFAASQDVIAYLVGTPQTRTEASQLHSRLPNGLRAAMPVALDSGQVLSDNYRHSGLTALLVTRNAQQRQTVSYAQNLSAKDSWAPLAQALGG